MTSEQKKRCNRIIHTASGLAAGVGAGLAQITGSDNAVITPIQISMVVRLGKVFGVKLTDSAAKAVIGTQATSIVGRAASQVLIGWVPGIGNIINATTAAGITEALGWEMADEFSHSKHAA